MLGKFNAELFIRKLLKLYGEENNLKITIENIEKKPQIENIKINLPDSKVTVK